MEKSSFFNAQMDASGEYDREYLAEDFASYFSKFISNGVFPNPSTGLQVIAADTPNMTVTLSVGYGYINGYKYENTTPLTFSIGVADGVLNRKDAIFIRYSKLGRAIKAYKIAGTPGASAVAPSVVRTEDYYDLCVAIISVNAGITAIPQSLIEDTRLNTSLCGIVTGLVEQVDTTTLYNQIQSDLSQFKTVSQAEFDAWFDDLKGKLGEDPATALQLQVDNLNAAAVGDSFKLKGDPISIEAAGANRIASITAYGENAQGGTTEAPVALTGVDSVFVSGNNLLPKAVRTETTGGITFTPNPDGSILVSGTTTTNVGYSYAHFERALLGRTVCLSGGSTQAQVLINERLSSGAFVRNVLVDRGQGISGILTKQKEDNILYATIQVLAGTTVNTTIYPMLNLGESPLPYEPYQGSVTPLPIPRPLRRVGDVKDKCVTRQDYESAKKLVVTYNVGFVELDGTEDVVFDTYGNTQKRIRFDLDRNAIARYALKFSHGNPGDTPTVTGGISASFNRDVLNRLQIIGIADTWTALGVTDTATAKTWLAAQKEAGTPVQIAYQLATPEVYATDPVDFDNAAGPLTVMTGGKLEVRMTELVGSRTYDADGDGVVDKAEKVSNALTLKNAAGEVVATFDGSKAAILQLTAALVGALGKTEKAADSSKLAGLAPVVDNPGPNNRNTWYFPFTGTNNRDGTRKYYAALYADNATTAGRASNLSMGLNGTDLWVYYS